MEEKTLKILLVEDEYSLYKRLKQFFEKKGFIILSVPGKPFIDNYVDATDACRTIPNLAVLDIDIKGNKNGFDIAQFIKERFYTPIIFFTGKNTDPNRAKARKLLAGGFVKKSIKPYDEDQLYEDIERLRPYATEADRLRTEEIFLNVQEYKNGKYAREYARRKISWEKLLSLTTVEGLRNYVELQLANDKKYLCHASLKEIETYLPPYFMKISSGTIINSSFIEAGGRSPWQFYFRNELTEVNPTFRSGYVALLIEEAVGSPLRK